MGISSKKKLSMQVSLEVVGYKNKDPLSAKMLDMARGSWVFELGVSSTIVWSLVGSMVSLLATCGVGCQGARAVLWKGNSIRDEGSLGLLLVSSKDSGFQFSVHCTNAVLWAAWAGEGWAVAPLLLPMTQKIRAQPKRA